MSVKALCKPCMVGQNVLSYGLAREGRDPPLHPPGRLRLHAFFVGVEPEKERRSHPVAPEQMHRLCEGGRDRAGIFRPAPRTRMFHPWTMTNPFGWMRRRWFEPAIDRGAPPPDPGEGYAPSTAPQAAPVAFFEPGVDQRPGPKNAGPARTGQPLRLDAASGFAPTQRPGAPPLDPGRRPHRLPHKHTPLTSTQVPLRDRRC